MKRTGSSLLLAAAFVGACYRTAPAPAPVPAPAPTAGRANGAPAPTPSDPTPNAGGGGRAGGGGAGAAAEPNPRPYAAVITAEAKTKSGLFKAHRIGAKLFFEIPRNELDRDMLLTTEIAKTTRRSRLRWPVARRGCGAVGASRQSDPAPRHELLIIVIRHDQSHHARRCATPTTPRSSRRSTSRAGARIRRP